MATPIVGIDLGTTNSCVAFLRSGKPEVIPNAEGSRVTPSVVQYDEAGQVFVGELAKRQLIVNPAETVRSIKRLIGRRFSEIRSDLSRFPYTVVGGEQDQIRIKIHGVDHSPEEISAEVLRKMKESAEAFLDEDVTQAVVTCPAYFNDSQRQSTKKAAELAGLEVLRIINEPTAASLAYGLGKGSSEHVAVFDFGGGTFDISILDLDKDVFEVRATCGDTALGGDDIDRILYEWIRTSIGEETGLDVNSDISAAQRVMVMAEKVKCELSAMESTTISLPFIVADAAGPKHYSATLTRQQFDEMIQPILERLLIPSRQALADAKLRPSEIATVLLVGGSTRILAVRRLVRDFFHREPSTSVNPDEAVAVGAAIQGGVLTGSLREVLLLDVTPLSLGIEVEGGVFSPLIPRNSSVPTTAKKRFTTVRDNQTAVWIHALQGERRVARENRTLGHFRLTGIPPAPREIPEIEVTFAIDANGILNVTATDVTSGVSQGINIESFLQAIEGDPEKTIEEAEKRADEDRRFLRETRQKIRYHRTAEMFASFVDRFQEKIEPADFEQIKKALVRLDFAVVQGDFDSAEQAENELTEMCNRYAEEFTRHKLGWSA
ncbi:molecular chaperone DnaK [Candidatus Sumerlaeota bacterium]|nr:molecular chaperone DnaK [Candidatus Sumerlaeota bacterium]